jgi:hypothetical protein
VGSPLNLPAPDDHREVGHIVSHERQPFNLAGIQDHFIVKDLPASLGKGSSEKSLDAQPLSDRRGVVMVKDESHV